MKRVKFLGGALVTVFLLLFFSAVAGATLLPPAGQVNNVPTVASPLPAGATLVAQATGSYALTHGMAGTVVEDVYAVTGTTYVNNGSSGTVVCPAGKTCLDFVYQFTESRPGQGVNSFSASDFDNGNILGWKTDIYTADPANAAAVTAAFGSGSGFSVPTPNTSTNTNTNSDPTNPATRSGTGPTWPMSTVTNADADSFGYTDGGLEPSVAAPGTPGESYIMIIATNAPKYVPGSVSIGTGSHTATSSVPNINGSYQPWATAYCVGCFGVGGFTSQSNTKNTGAYANNGVGYGTLSNGTFLAPIPEPGFYGVLAIGLAVLFVAVKYRRNKQTA